MSEFHINNGKDSNLFQKLDQKMNFYSNKCKSEIKRLEGYTEHSQRSAMELSVNLIIIL